ncbi:hypothetical protein KBD59_01340 [Candidatus Gracilibacteria bacterium]|nr:hypothetical protein [Candidatus Gracilibacteria bacterium]
MISQETPTQSTAQPRILIIAAVAFVVVSAFSAYYQISKTQLENKITALEGQKKELITPSASQTRESKRAKALEVKAKLDDLKESSIEWSRIAERIDRTIPKTPDTQQPVIIVRTYNGTTDGRLTLNAMTRPESGDAFKDVADVISAFSSDPSFKNVFVPSITRSLTVEGATVISFSMNMNFLKDALTPDNLTDFSVPAEATTPAATTTPTTPATQKIKNPASQQSTPTPVAPAQPK